MRLSTWIRGPSLVLAIAVLTEGLASAQTMTVPAPAVDARVRALYAYRDATGQTLPLYRPRRSFEETGMAPLLVRFSREPTPEESVRYQRLGFLRGRELVSGAVKVLARPEALDAMESDDLLARVSVDLAPARMLMPLDEARRELAIAEGAAAWMLANGTPLTGNGVVVGDVDSSVDVFHPAFFRTLPPVLWVDVDQNGVLTPGIDGVDQNLDGEIEPREILLQLDGAAHDNQDLVRTPIYGTDDASFNPGWDYLFLDLDGDGKRDAGYQEVDGAEALPAMGEPVFAADDVNKDGTVSVPERVVPLGASKFRAVEEDGVVYRRGENLARFRPNEAGRGHATKMIGSIAGGQPGISRFLGVAPDVEVLLSNFVDSDASVSDSLQWLADEGAQVIVTEVNFFGYEPMDGSSELEALIDAIVEQNRAVVVSPAGNLGGGRRGLAVAESGGKHALASIPPAGAQPYQNGFEVDVSGTPTEVGLSITWREGQLGVTGSLALPDGDVIDLGTEATASTTAVGRQYTVIHGVTPLGAGYLILSLETAGHELPASGMALTLNTDAATAATATLFVTDDASAYWGGVSFQDWTRDGSIAVPALATRTIAVSAYALHSGGGFSEYVDDPGTLRTFTGRGPDLWGDPGVDIAALDNPVVARIDTYDAGVGEGLGVGWQEMGGTSGAGAITAGVAALFRQRDPNGTALEVRQAVLDAALTDDAVTAGTPAQWGAGKLRVANAMAAHVPRRAGLIAPPTAAPDVTVELSAELLDDGAAAVRSRWDFGYDDVWETDWQDGLTIETPMPDAEFFDVRVEVMDAEGWVAPAVARVVRGAPIEPPPEPEPPEEAVDEGCGCRVAGESSSAATAVGLLFAAGALRRRSRSRRRDQDGAVKNGTK